MSIFVASQMSMSMSIIFLYSTESWSISTALCVLSGIDETDSSSTIVWSCCCWVPDHGDCPVASSRLSNLQQRRPDDRKCWADNEVRSGDVKYLTVNDVGWECLRLVFKCTKNTSIWKTKTHSTWRSARQCLSLGKSFSSLDQKHRCTRSVHQKWGTYGQLYCSGPFRCSSPPAVTSARYTTRRRWHKLSCHCCKQINKENKQEKNK